MLTENPGILRKFLVDFVFHEDFLGFHKQCMLEIIKEFLKPPRENNCKIYHPEMLENSQHEFLEVSHDELLRNFLEKSLRDSYESLLKESLENIQQEFLELSHQAFLEEL